ncbi:MAG TPA: hypothetical protein VHM24_13545 [Gemmatimonadaceae bacterium]|nr:hypothetical protein [Gemmatimonadaceae bacterium]
MGNSIFRLVPLLLVVATLGETQQPLTGPQRVVGQVVRPGTKSMLPVPNIWVTLHRVGSDRAAPLDSVRSDVSGRYKFDFERSGDSTAIYFVSASYGGIAYFTPPLAHDTVRGEEAEIAVFDTTSAPVPISVRGHHLIVSAVDASGSRTITEVYELANDTSVTRIASTKGDGSVWAAPFPPQASNFQVSQGDIPAMAVRFANGKARVYAPIAPGLKQLAFSYSVPATAFPLSVPITGDTQILEVLIEDEKGVVSGAKLAEKAPVAVERRSFRRFLADDVPANSVSVIDLPAAVVQGQIDPRYMIALTAVFGAAMILALARALRRR